VSDDSQVNDKVFIGARMAYCVLNVQEDKVGNLFLLNVRILKEGDKPERDICIFNLHIDQNQTGEVKGNDLCNMPPTLNGFTNLYGNEDEFIPDSGCGARVEVEIHDTYVNLKCYANLKCCGKKFIQNVFVPRN
jgi:hypothetical protein